MILGSPDRPVQDRVMDKHVSSDAFSVSWVVVLCSLDRHDTYMYMTRPIWQVKKNPTTDSSMHDRLGKQAHTRIINRQVVL